MNGVAVLLGYSNPDEAFVQDAIAFEDRAAAEAWIDSLPEPQRWDWTALTLGVLS